ncbi:MAG: PAS domain S-box protein [Spirochaetes bacterium]|nr:PAS domain S-box protein [Spirochaetota bacterium]
MNRCRILIVEDDAIIASGIVAEIEAWGGSITSIESTGRGALYAIGRERPDLVIMDIEMEGGMDGIEAAGYIRAEHEVPVIFMTAYSDDTLIARAKETGPYGYILKPYRPNELRIAIEMALQRQKMDQKLRETNRRLEREIEERRRIEEELQVRSNTIINSINGIAISDGAGNLTFVNRSFLGMWGYDDASEVIGRNATQFWQTREEPALVMKEVLSSGGWIGELKAIRKDGSLFDAQIAASCIFDDNGTAVSFMGSFMDVSERRQAEEALRESEARYAALFNNSIEMVYVTDTRGMVYDANDLALDTFGYSRDELGSISIADLIHAQYRDGAFAVIKEIMDTGAQSRIMEYRMRTKTGRTLTVETTGTLIMREGKPEGILGIARDITRRKEIEQALRSSEEKFSKIFNFSPISLALSNIADGTLLDVNDSLVELIGHTREELIGCRSTDLGIWTDPGERRGFADSLAAGESVQGELVRMRRKDGREITVMFSATRMRMGSEESQISAAVDVTARVRAEESLRASREMLRSVFNGTPIMMCVVDRDRQVVRGNRAFREITGWPEPESASVMACGILGCVNADDDPRGCGYGPSCGDCSLFNAIEGSFADGKERIGIEQKLIIKRRDQLVDIHYLGSTTMLPSDDGPMLLLCLQDITLRKKTEEALRESEEKLRKILHGSSIPQFVIDRDHRVIYWNRALEVASRLPSEEMIGTKNQWMAFYNDERPCMADLLIDGKTNYNDLENWYGGKYEKSELLDEAYEGIDFFPNLGDEGKWLHFTAAIIRDEDGAIIGALETLVDITEHRRAEIAVEESERKYREIVENANSIILRMDQYGVITFFNDYAQSFLGFSKDEIMGRNVIGTIVPEADSSGSDLNEMILGIAKNPEDYVCNENENIKKNGERVWVSWTNRVIEDESGNVREILCIGNDITERRKAEQDLSRSESKYRALYENLRDGSASVDSEGSIVECNGRFLEMLGYPAEEINRLNFYDVTPPRWHAMEKKILSEQVDVRGYSDVYEKEYITKGGAILPVELQAYLRTGPDGRPDGYWALVRDISARKAAEDELVRSEKKYRELADFLPEIVFELGANASFTYVNRAAFSMLGYRPEDLPRINMLDLFIPEDRDRCWANFMTISRGERSHGNEYTMVRQDGTLLPVIIYSRAKYFEGELNGVRGIVVDITERRRIETALRESESRYRSLVETTPCLICTIDPDGTTFYVNSQVVEITGYRQDEVIGKNWWDLFYPEESDVQARDLLRIFESGDVKGYEMILRAKDGTIRTIMWNSFNERFPDGAVSVVHGVGMDITLRKRFETALWESEVKFRSLFESSGDAQILMDDDLVIDCNEAALAMMGCAERKDLVGRQLQEFCPESQPDGDSSAAKGRAFSRRAMEERSVRFEWQHRRKNGDHFYAEVVLTAIPIEGRSFLHATLRDVTDRRLLQERIITIVDEEQQRLGRNLHDGLGQDLTGTAFMCNSLAKRLGDLDLKERARAEEITRHVYGVITKVRALSRELYPPNLVENEIAFTLEDFASNVENVFGITCRYQQDPGIVVANIHVSTQIYYIVREAVHNALRHGKAGRILISLTVKKDRVRLLIKDNGAGVRGDVDGGLGLKIMKYRMESVHGTFEIRRNRVRGTSVVCEIPRRLIGGKE